MARKYILKANPKNPKLLDITPDNVARAEAMIRSDSRYNQNKVGTSILKLRPLISHNRLSSTQGLDLIFKEIVSAINISNSTRMSHTEEDMIVSFLMENHDSLIERLYKRDFCLICELVKCSPRKNYAFATKFCHYMCFNLFVGRKQQDNYSIYDNVVAGVLGEYAAEYGIYNNKMEPYTVKDFNTYKKYAIYSEVIDKIILSLGAKVSRNGFDHLLWYANK